MFTRAAPRHDAARRAPAGPLILAVASVTLLVGNCRADDIDDLIQNIERNEALYKDIEFTYKKTYVSHAPKEETEGLPFKAIRQDETTRRLVYQADKVFSSETSSYVNFGSDDVETSKWIYAWDGQVGHNLRGQILHIFDEPSDTTNWPRPHNLLLDGYRRAPWSLLCRGGPSARRVRGFEDSQVEAEIVGRERVDGDECIKLKLLIHRDGRDPMLHGGVRLIWFNTAKNYLPVRSIRHPAGSSPDQMTGLDVVESLTAIEGGLWFPQRVARKSFDKEGQFKAGNPRIETATVCSDIKLNPKNDPALFGEFPVGIDVLKYRIKNGKIVETVQPIIPARLPFLPGGSAGE